MAHQLLPSPIMDIRDSPYQLNTGSGDYFFCIEGLPIDFTWKKLKDLARKGAPNLGWTEMALTDEWEARNRGWIRVKYQNEAYNLYDFLRKDPLPNRQLRVYLWLTTESPPQLVACNCPPIPPHGYNSKFTDGATEIQATRAAGRYAWLLSTKPLAVQHVTPLQAQQPALGRIHAPLTPRPPLNFQSQPRTGHSQANQNLSRPIAPVQQFIPSAGLPSVSGGICSPLTLRTSSNLQPRAREAAPNQSHLPTPQSTCLHSPNIGLPINTSTSHVSSRSRSISISGLDMNTTSQTLHVYLSTVGMLETCKLQMHAAGQSKGCAFAKFATIEAAGIAVKRFNGAVFEGKTLLVGYDKTDEDVKGGKEDKKKDGVVIANGSTQRT